MKNKTIFHINRLFLVSLLTACFMFFTQSVLAEQIYVKVGGSHHRQCPRGYRMVFTPKHWRHGRLIPGQYHCAPIHNRHRDGYRRW
jgi:hypothetical protein